MEAPALRCVAVGIRWGRMSIGGRLFLQTKRMRMSAYVYIQLTTSIQT